MKVTLTGATGFIGSHVLTELQGHGHEVTALVRDASQADAVAARGATPTVLDLHDRAAVVGNPNLPGGRSEAAKLQEWFNTSAFQNPPVGSPASSPRDFLRAPGFFNLNYALVKSFPIRYGPLKETQKIDFRAEFFNVFNHPNFGAPDTSIGDLQFGQILSARDPRIMQFALKYIF